LQPTFNGMGNKRLRASVISACIAATAAQ